LGKSIAVFPLITGQEWVGLLVTTSNEVVHLQANEIRQIESLTDQVAAVVQRKQSEEVLAQRARELQIVARVSMATTAELDPERLLHLVVDLTKESFNLYHAHVYLMDSSTSSLFLVAGAGEVGRIMVAKGWRIPLGAEKSLVARAARSRQGIIVNDVRADPGFLPNEYLPDTRSELAVPMIIGDTVLGVLDVQSKVANQFTDETLNIQTTLASQIAAALQNARQYEQTQRRAENLAVLNEIGALAASLDVTRWWNWLTNTHLSDGYDQLFVTYMIRAKKRWNFHWLITTHSASMCPLAHWDTA
jgi:GAF domain-containing protein